MTEAEIHEELMRRFLAVQTPWGRWRLCVFVKWKQLAWQNVVHAAIFIKRALDIVGSIIALIFFSPVFLILAILVKLDGGPVFFRQRRVGFMGREFTMPKYRSMCVDAEAKLKDLLARNEMASGVTFQMKDDPRVTKIGKILRKTSLDELPQFLNVLRGEMSLVGPGPPVLREVALYSQADRRRLLVKPGITCLWQVGERHGWLLEIGDRHATDFPEQVALDVRYIESQNVWHDLLILMKTIPSILFGKVS